MGDLDNSPLFDSRHLEFIGSILRNRPLNPLSGVEIKFLKQSLILKELNDEHFNDNLVYKLGTYKNYVAVQVAVQFLVLAREHSMLKEAMEILETSVVEKRGGDLGNLLHVLEEAKNMPSGWALTVWGEVDSNRHSRESYTMPSGLNLEAMRNFK